LRGEQSKERARAWDLAAGFKILESCRRNLEFGSLDKRALQGASRSWCSAGRGTGAGKKKNKRALQGASRSWCSAGRGTEREKKEQNNRKKRATKHTGDLDTQMRRSTALRMFLSYVMVQTRKEGRKLRSTI
jgi:hypothetical protein